MKQRIEKEMNKGRKIKLLFEYPNTNSVKVRKGYVMKVKESSFDFLDDKVGLATYKYKYLVEIISIKDNKNDT